jgi:SAM-dependent methyltransferase
MEHKPVSDNWQRGDFYERYVGRWSRQIAPMFLAWIHCEAGLRWLDVGCGTGALSSAIVAGCSPVQVVSVDPSAGFLKLARQHLQKPVFLAQATATDSPLGPASMNVVVSGLVLNFIPDPHAALVEMVRVTHQGGTIGAYVWDYAGKMELMRLFWDAAAAVDPDAGPLDEGIRFPLCQPEALRKLFAQTGLHEIAVEAIDIQTNFTSFDDYWQPFLGGTGSAPAYLMTLDTKKRVQLRDRLRDSISIAPDGSISLIARAWAVRGTVNK